MTRASQYSEKHVMSHTACRILEGVKGKLLKIGFQSSLVSL